MVSFNYQEGELVLCTVEKVIGTTVFVRLEGNGEGTITLSEIAPGRIRNLRDYVSPGKRIVCKVLHIREHSLQLSLRRVGINEKKDFLQKIDKEKANKAILKTVLGEEESLKIIQKISDEQSITEFLEDVKKDPKIMENYVSKDNAEKILKILESKKEKPKEIKQIFKISSKSPNGIVLVKDIVNNSCKGVKCNVTYIAAGKYSMSMIGEDFKEIKTEINKVMANIEKDSKKNKCDFEVDK